MDGLPKNTTNLYELLKGCNVMRGPDNRVIVQTIGAMQIAFLQASPEFTDPSLGNPLDALKARNSHYGQLTLSNVSDNPVIVPAQIAVFQPAAQNHAMMKAAYLEKRARHSFEDASCVEGAQGGYLSDEKPHEWHMIPLLMRPYLFGQVGGGHFGKSYQHVERLNVLMDVPGGANYIHRYFERYGDQLQKFIAHFERPDGIIGFVVMVNGEIIAIDKFPNMNYPEYFWELIVRDCYASVAIALGKAAYGHPHIVIVDEDMQESSNPAEHLEMAYMSMRDLMSKRVEDSIRALGAVEFDCKSDSDNLRGTDRTESLILKSDGWSGQVISKVINGEIVNVYVSLVRNSLMAENALTKINNAANVRRVSSKQKPLQI